MVADNTIPLPSKESFADLELNLSSGVKIPAHSAILKVRCPAILDLVDNFPFSEHTGEILVNFIYQNSVNLEAEDISSVLELSRASEVVSLPYLNFLTTRRFYDLITKGKNFGKIN
jgi:hypothetical protein